MTDAPDAADPPASALAFLGVEHSLNDRAWRLRDYDERMAMSIAQVCGVPDLIARLLSARGQTPESTPGFLSPRLRDLLPDPSGLRDMDVAVDRLARAIRSGETIAVFGDYDVDGATSAALLLRFLRAAGGAAARLYVPDRMSEGYGPNAVAMRKLREEGAGVVVTLDCGITAFEPLAEAKALGLDAIVVDHHVAEPRLPLATAIVNPNRLDEVFPCRQLAAVGVAFMLVVALNRELRRAGWYTDMRPEPDLMSWLDLVALGTICDVVPLTGANRALVAQGLKIMSQRSNIGIRALSDVAGIADRALEAYHAGFILGPRVNAGGRVGRADLGARLLSTDDPALALELARALEVYNSERRAIEARVIEQAMGLAEAEAGKGSPLLFVVGEDWHQGVIGIVAGRLKERFQRPVCVVTTANGAAKASARSVAGVDLGSAVIAAREAGILEKGGGHAMAAGFECRVEALGLLREFLSARIASVLGAGAPASHPLLLDGLLQAGAASADFVRALEALGPYGSGNAEPRFAMPSMRVIRSDPVGENHVRSILVGSDGAQMKAIAFRANGGELGRALLSRGGGALHLAGRLKINSWQGREDVQFQIEDGAIAKG